ncbi:hypothetical protein [Ensifer sp. LC163]|uniref:hypothetical protein n=1 Tax=Ensifer sp. LC163 TaxID=1120652 RepID=UPI0008139C14|nr:hypothetical protein [Ensifer sp. LC163]OCP34401.1 hypothetical protein BC360_30255 [Ensifer sp. LC163]
MTARFHTQNYTNLTDAISNRVFVPYDALLNDFEGVCNRIGSLLKVEWPIPMVDARANIAAFIRSDLRHHQASGDSLSSLDVVDGFVNQILASIERLERDPCDEQAMRTLSSLREELDNPPIRFVDATFDEFADRQARHAEIFRSHVGQIQQDAEMKSVQLTQAQQEIELKSAQLAQALRDAGVMSDQLHHLQAALQTETMKLEEVQRQQFQSLNDLAAAEARADMLEKGLNEILSSFSWRATRLMRVLGSFLGGPATEDPRSSAK